MEKRYYYTDPLAAAWMAKHFGMRFNNAFWHRHLECTEEITDMYELTKGPVVGKFNVRPESLHLLEPKIGDVVDIGHPIVCAITAFSEFRGKRLAESLDDRSFYPKQIDAIIQRDGKPFHWPECDQ